jgi:hypothetical protein
MYTIDLFQYKSQFHYVFNVSPGNQGSPITFFSLYGSRTLWTLAALSRLSKHEYECARNNRFTVGNGVFLRGPCRDVISKGQSKSVIRQFWKGGCEDRISTVRSRCQRTASEDTAGWKKISGCCGNLWILEISGGDIITSTYASCV